MPICKMCGTQLETHTNEEVTKCYYSLSLILDETIEVSK